MRFDVEKFTEKTDFGLWKAKMEALLIHQGLDAALLGDKGFAEGFDAKEKATIMGRARSTIILSLDDKILREVIKIKTAKEIWDKLEDMYNSKTSANKLHLRKRLFNFRISTEKSISQQLDEFNKMCQDLESVSIEVSDEDKALVILGALPKSYEHFIDALVIHKSTKLTYEDVDIALRNKELHKGPAIGNDNATESLNIKERWSHKLQVKNKAPMSADTRKFEKFKSAGGNHSEKRKCFYCKMPGHLKKQCFKFKRDQKAGQLQVSDSENNNAHNAQIAESAHSYGDAEGLVVSEVCSVVKSRSYVRWVLDSGCSFHMSPNLEWFVNYKAKKAGSVLLGDDYECNIEGIGDIRLKLHDGVVRLLTNVRYIPKLKRNLISLGVLDGSGHKYSSENGVLSITKHGITVMKGVKENGLYYLVGDTVSGESAHVSAQDNTQLWHARMGHLSEKGLRQLSKQNLLGGDQITHLQFCENCVLGKSHKVGFDTAKHTTQAPLDYLHSDLWGPTNTQTMSGGRYFMSIIDDYSRKVWLIILKTKDEAFCKFKEWSIEVENTTGRKIKHLRTDNGLEFLSGEFNEFCKTKGIVRHRTIPGTPQQNGVAKRFNRTVLERIRCMLISSGLSKCFWGEAATTACYLINRSPTTPLNNLTPEELWSGKPPYLGHLKSTLR